jgi:CHAD domain-containing protein
VDEPKVARAVEGMKKFQERLGDYRDQQLLLEHLATLNTNSENNPGDSATINTLVDSLQEKLKKQRKQAKQYRKRGKQKRLLKNLNSALRQLNK